MIKKYKHIIWDWNGTLLDDVNLCVDIINGLLNKHNIKALSCDEYREIFTFPVKDYYIKAGLDFEKESFENMGIYWMNEYEKRKSEANLFNETKCVLTAIMNHGIKQSILSAYKHDTLINIITSLGLESYFSYITGLDHIYAHGKIDIGMDLVSKISLDKNEIVLIGDTIHDYEVAREIGAECILISTGHQSKNRLLTCGVPVLNSISELIQ